MRLVTRHTIVPLWHYQCPQCGIGSAELGEYAVADTIYCEVCIEDERPARLRRWPVEDDGEGPASVAPSAEPAT